MVLTHHGIKGQKHGVRNAGWYPIAAWKAHLRRDGKTSDRSHSTGNISDRKRRKLEKKVAKQRSENLAKAREAKAKADASRKEKEEIIKNGDIEKALTRIDDFTNEELRAITDRNQAKINLAKAKTDAVISKMGTVADVTQKVSSITSNGINIYNNLAKIANAFGDTELPIIGQNQNNDKQNNQQNQNQNQNSSNKDKEQAARDKKIDKDIEKRIKDIDKAAKKNAEKAAKEAEKEPEHYSGDVEGEPTRAKSTEKTSETKEKPPVDTTWKDVTEDDIRRGEKYVQEALEGMNYPLLELKKKK